MIKRFFATEIHGDKFSFNITNEDDIIANFICDQTHDNGDVYQLLSGYVKWDGCMELWWDSSMHFCGFDNINMIKILLELIYTECKNTFNEGTFNL